MMFQRIPSAIIQSSLLCLRQWSPLPSFVSVHFVSIYHSHLSLKQIPTNPLQQLGTHIPTAQSARISLLHNAKIHNSRAFPSPTLYRHDFRLTGIFSDLFLLKLQTIRLTLHFQQAFIHMNCFKLFRQLKAILAW